MSDDAIRRALEVAAQVACYGGMSGDRCDQCTHPSQCRSMADWQPGTAAAIAAFLEAPPGLSALPVPDGGLVGIKVDRMRALAAAVRRAAGGG